MRVEADFLLPPYNKTMCSLYTERHTEKRKEGGWEGDKKEKEGTQAQLVVPWYSQGVGSRSPSQ